MLKKSTLGGHKIMWIMYSKEFSKNIEITIKKEGLTHMGLRYLSSFFSAYADIQPIQLLINSHVRVIVEQSCLLCASSFIDLFLVKRVRIISDAQFSFRNN